MRILAITNNRENFFSFSIINHSNPIFQARVGNRTSAGNVLKKLRNITCPYTGTKMIPGSSINRINKRLDACDNVEKVVKELLPFKDYLQPVEKQMYEKFTEYSKRNPSGKLPDCLKEMYEDSLTKLKLEEFVVLDDVDRISLHMSPKTAFALRYKTTRCRQVILKKKKEDTFKRKTLLTSLDEIIPEPYEKTIFEQMKDRALYLPTSSTSPNAFVVKYADRSHDEIAKRLLRASEATIEHILPDSKGGKNSIANFLLVSSKGNSLRENIPLVKFIQRFPNIPELCQKYVEEIIKAIYNGELKRNETYPYKIQRTLEKESGGKIKLDLTDYKYSPDEAKRLVRAHYNKTRKFDKKG